jgi:hypothetical protein
MLGDLFTKLAHEARQRIHILDQRQSMLQERGDRGDVAVTEALDDLLGVCGVAVHHLVDHHEHAPRDQHGMPIVAGQVPRTYHAEAITIFICGVNFGADSWGDIELFGKTRTDPEYLVNFQEQWSFVRHR